MAESVCGSKARVVRSWTNSEKDAGGDSELRLRDAFCNLGITQTERVTAKRGTESFLRDG